MSNGLFKQYKTAGESLKARAQIIPDLAAVICGDTVVTNKEMYESSNRFANFLLEVGYKKGDRVALLCYNLPEYAAVLYGCMCIGVIPISGVNVRYVPKEMKYVLEEMDPKMLVLHEDFVDSINQIHQNLNIKDYVVVGKKVPGDMLSYEEVMRRYPETEPKFDWEIKPDDDGLICMTGGTTGYPKGAVWTNDVMAGAVLADALPGLLEDPEWLTKITPDALKNVLKSTSLSLEWLSPLLLRILKSQVTKNALKSPITSRLLMEIGPRMLSTGLVYRLVKLMGGINLIITSGMYHSGGVGSFGTGAALGSGAIFFTKKMGFDPKEFCEIVEKRKPLMALVIGDPMWKPLITYLDSHAEEHDLSSLFVLESMGSPCTASTKKALLKYLPNSVILDFAGSTEASIQTGSVFTASDETFETSKIGRIKVKSRQHDVRVINPETLKDVKPGELGEIIYHDTSAKSYFGDPERTAKSFRVMDGKRFWFSGDGATVDEEGYIHFTGRMSGSINTGGEKVYPEEVEDVIRSYPSVEKVVVVGIPDEKWGEAVTAVVKLAKGKKTTEEEIISYCRDKMARFKRPKHVVFLDEIPVSIESGEEKMVLPKVKLIATKLIKEGRMPTDEELIEAFEHGKRV